MCIRDSMRIVERLRTRWLTAAIFPWKSSNRRKLRTTSTGNSNILTCKGSCFHRDPRLLGPSKAENPSSRQSNTLSRMNRIQTSITTRGSTKTKLIQRRTSSSRQSSLYPTIYYSPKINRRVLLTIWPASHRWQLLHQSHPIGTLTWWWRRRIVRGISASARAVAYSSSGANRLITIKDSTTSSSTWHRSSCFRARRSMKVSPKHRHTIRIKSSRVL